MLPLKRAPKTHMGGKKLSKVWSRREDPVRKKILFLLIILPSPLPDSWMVSLLCNLSFEWFYWWWTPCRSFRRQYWNKASMSQNGSTLNCSTLEAPLRWEHRLRKSLTQVRRRQAAREHLVWNIVSEGGGLFSYCLYFKLSFLICEIGLPHLSLSPYCSEDGKES